jgi:DNA-binding response OmpR family regulator
MTEKPINILIVEDNEADARLCKEALSEDPIRVFETVVAGSVSKAMAEMDQGNFDAVLLDLSLPDSDGLDTVSSIFRRAQNIPIIVTTGRNDEQLGLKALTLGASDYLPKAEINGAILCRAVNYAIERQHLQRELHRARERERELREIEALVRLSAEPVTSATARALGQRPIRELVPDLLGKIATEYEAVFLKALDGRVSDSKDNYTEDLRQIAWQMGFLQAKAPDVVDLHADVTQKLMERASSERRQGIIEAGHPLVLELMGFVVEYYRNMGRGSQGDVAGAPEIG